MVFNISKNSVAETMDLQHFQTECWQYNWFYNSFKQQVFNTLGFTTCSINQLLKCLAAGISKNSVAETNGFSNIVFVNVVEPLVLATLFSNMLQHQCFLPTFSKAETTTKTTETNVGKTIGFTTCSKHTLLRHWVLHIFQKETVSKRGDCCHFQKYCCEKQWV